LKLSILPAVLATSLAFGAIAKADEIATQTAPLSEQATPRVLLTRPKLEWTPDRSRNVEVKVYVDYSIKPDGTVDQPKAEPGAEYAFAMAARNAIRRLVYSPAPVTTTARALAIFRPVK